MNDTTEIFSLFNRKLLPSDLSQAKRLEIATLCQSSNLAKGETLQPQLNDDRLVFVGDGAIKLVAQASQQREQVIAFYFCEDLFTIPQNSAHDYVLQALCDSELLLFPYNSFLQSVQHDARILEHLLECHQTSLQRSHEKTIALGQKTAGERLASFLLAMADRIGMRDGSRIVITLPMSRRDIADSLGLTIETVSRQFSKMREQGLIQTEGRSAVSLTSPEILAGLAGDLRRTAA